MSHAMPGLDLAQSPRARTTWPKVALVSALLMGLLCLPLVATGSVLFQVQPILLFMAAGVGLDVALGYGRELLLSQVAVIGVASYCTGILDVHRHVPPWLTLPASVAAAIAAQVLVCLPGLRIRGLYLGVLSFFAVLIFPDLVQLLGSITGGDVGLLGISTLGSSELGQILVPYFVCVGVLTFSVALVVLFIRSGWGTRLKCLGEAPSVLASCGLSLGRTKLTSYVVAAIPAGCVGWALTYVNQSVNSSNFGIAPTLVIFAGVELIGPGSVVGALGGVALLEGYSQFVGEFSAWNTLGLGLLLAAVVIAAPGGLARLLQAPARVFRARLGHSGQVQRPAAQDAVSSVRGKRLAGGAGPQIVPGSPQVEGASDRNRLNHVRTILAPTSPPPVELPSGDAPTGDPEPGVRVMAVSKSFGGNQAVHDVTLSVGQGRVMALMGDNGSGKTTLLNLISGLVGLDSGNVLIRGEEVAGLRPYEVARMGCGRTFQTPQLVGGLTVRQNVEIGLLFRHSASALVSVLRPLKAAAEARTRRDLAMAACAQAGVPLQMIDKPADAIPVGTRRLVELARAIATGATAVCLDEPSVGLNDEELAELSRVVRALASEGRSILLVEHNPRFVATTADDVALMKRGSVVGTFDDIHSGGPPAPLLEHMGAWGGRD